MILPEMNKNKKKFCEHSKRKLQHIKWQRQYKLFALLICFVFYALFIVCALPHFISCHKQVKCAPCYWCAGPAHFVILLRFFIFEFCFLLFCELKISFFPFINISSWKYHKEKLLWKNELSFFFFFNLSKVQLQNAKCAWPAHQ